MLLYGKNERVGKVSIEAVREHLKKWGRDQDIMEFDTVSATVTQAAETIGVAPEEIAKTLSFRGNDNDGFLIVTSGDAKIDNKKFKQFFGFKARMLSAEEVLERTGHPVGGVCPFGLKTPMEIYLDVSLKRFPYVYPACGSINSAIKLTNNELFEYANAKGWIDVCKDWQTVENITAIPEAKN